MLYRDQEVVAFLDHRPATMGHSLIIPRSHAQSLAELKPRIASQLFFVGRLITHALTSSSIRCEGITLNLAGAELTGQTVAHVHLHVIPRYTGDGLTVGAPRLQLLPEQMEAAAKDIRSGMANSGSIGTGQS
jgi:histidine triad (HIT) family protein